MKIKIILIVVLVIFRTDLNEFYGDKRVVFGFAEVIDGDTLRISGERFRLYGIDAPERDQVCEKGGKQYHCGDKAARLLSGKIAGVMINCERKVVDRYRRIVALCRLGGVDLSAWMVREGWAIAYRKFSMDYVEEESVARIGRHGIWAGQFVAPWKWRRSRR